VPLGHFAFTFCSGALASPLALGKTKSNTYINHFKGYEQVNSLRFEPYSPVSWQFSSGSGVYSG